MPTGFWIPEMPAEHWMYLFIAHFMFSAPFNYWFIKDLLRKRKKK